MIRGVRVYVAIDSRAMLRGKESRYRNLPRLEVNKDLKDRSA